MEKLQLDWSSIKIKQEGILSESFSEFALRNLQANHTTVSWFMSRREANPYSVTVAKSMSQQHEYKSAHSCKDINHTRSSSVCLSDLSFQIFYYIHTRTHTVCILKWLGHEASGLRCLITKPVGAAGLSQSQTESTLWYLCVKYETPARHLSNSPPLAKQSEPFAVVLLPERLLCHCDFLEGCWTNSTTHSCASLHALNQHAVQNQPTI